MKFDVVYYDTVSAPFSRRLVSSRPSGGSELNHVKIVHGLADAGYSVLVLNNLERGEVDGGVVYDNYRAVEHDIVRCQTLVISRFSDPWFATDDSLVRGIRCDRIIMAANDQFQEFQRSKYIQGSSLVVHNDWHAANFPAEWPKTIIPAIVPQAIYDLPRVPKNRNKFVYASAVCKGLRTTLREWQGLKRAYEELKDAQLYVTTPGHDVLSKETIESYGAHYLGELAPDAVVETLRDAAGLFFVNTLPETFCVIAAIAEALGCRCHVWTQAGGAVAETVRTNRYVSSGQKTFRGEFLQAYRFDRYSNTEVLSHDFSPSKVIPMWEEVLGLTRREMSTTGLSGPEEPSADAPSGSHVAYHTWMALNTDWNDNAAGLFEKAEHCRKAFMPERALTAYLDASRCQFSDNLPGKIRFKALLEAARLQMQLALPEAAETYNQAVLAGSQAESLDVLIELARFHRSRSEWRLAAACAEHALDRDQLNPVSWQALDELSVASYHLGLFSDQRDLCWRLLDLPTLPVSERPRIELNLQFALDALKAKEAIVSEMDAIVCVPSQIHIDTTSSSFTSNFIHIHENAIDGDLCEDLRTLFEAALVCGATHRMDATWRRCTICPLPPPGMAASQKLYERFAEAIRPRVEEYKKLSVNLGAVNLIEPPSIILYEPGETPEHFAEHADDWNDESATRQISVIAYLNDVEQGGETIFPKLGVTVPPKAGRLLLFPSAFTHMHKAMAPVSNDKFCVVTWMHFPGGKYPTIAF